MVFLGVYVSRDILAEAIAIAEGRTVMLARREHLEAVLGTLHAMMRKEDFELMKLTHAYPAPELAHVRFVGAEGNA